MTECCPNPENEISKRDMFAAMAMQALLPKCTKGHPVSSPQILEIVKISIECADELLYELNNNINEK